MGRGTAALTHRLQRWRRPKRLLPTPLWVPKGISSALCPRAGLAGRELRQRPHCPCRAAGPLLAAMALALPSGPEQEPAGPGAGQKAQQVSGLGLTDYRTTGFQELQPGPGPAPAAVPMVPVHCCCRGTGDRPRAPSVSAWPPGQGQQQRKDEDSAGPTHTPSWAHRGLAGRAALLRPGGCWRPQLMGNLCLLSGPEPAPTRTLGAGPRLEDAAWED